MRYGYTTSKVGLMLGASPNFLVLLLGALAVAACAPAGPRPAGDRSDQRTVVAAQPRTLSIVLRLEPTDLTSAAATYNRITLALFGTGYRAGLAAKDRHEAPYPLLAESLPQLNTATWQVLADGQMETIHRLRPGLTWHDGVAVAAEDFVFTGRAIRTQMEWGLVAPSVEMRHIEEIQATDARTIRIRWRQTYAEAATPELTPYARHLLSPSLDQEQPEAFSSHPYWTTEYIGVGPYRVARWERGAYIEGTAFEGYALGPPRIERVRVTWSGDPNSTVTRLLAGDAHVALDSAIQYQHAAALRRAWSPQGAGAVLLIPRNLRWLQVQHRPAYVSPRALLDLRVRKALIHALDRQALADAMLGGEGLVADTMGPPTLSFFEDVVRATTKYPYDLPRSEQLMAEVGFAKGAAGLYESPTAGRFNPEVFGLAEGDEAQETTIVADYLRQAGMDTRLRLVPAPQVAQSDEMKATFPALRTNYTGGSAHLGQPFLVSSRIAAPENRWRGTNRIGWSHPEHDRLFDAWNLALDRAERNQLMVHMLKLVNEELPGIPMYFDFDVVAHAAALQGPEPIAPDSTAYGNIHQWKWASPK